jgi:GNAT superfamily N-acetyltransferase
MKVREATISDLASVTELLKAFTSATTAHFSFVDNDDQSIEASVLLLLNNPLARVFLAETDDGRPVGTVSGLLYPIWFNHKHLTGQEMFWFVDPDHRRSKAGKLLFDALEKWAASTGAQSFSMASAAGPHQKRVNQIYEKKGYAPTETSYIKEL